MQLYVYTHIYAFLLHASRRESALIHSHQYRSMKWQRVGGRALQVPTASVVQFIFPNMKSCRKQISKDVPAATKSKRRAHNGICILFDGVLYQTFTSFAREYGFQGTNSRKMAWFKQQLSNHSLNDRLRFLRGESLSSISTSLPKDVRHGRVDVKNMHQLFVPANRKVKIGNAGLFKSTVLT